uniref:Uncharacterized protein n=1 Tax=Arundo donax TaxID=35708 RepID=A0A0A9B843_ARUDO
MSISNSAQYRFLEINSTV